MTTKSVGIPDAFWNARPELQAIRQAAHSRVVSPDAVLGAVLATIGASARPGLTLPPTVASRKPPSIAAGLIGPPGAAKSSCADIGREWLGLSMNAIEVPIGSGEGIAEAYYGMVPDPGDPSGVKKVRGRDPDRERILFVADEASSFLKKADRKGATLMGDFRSAWSGVTIGQSNADSSKRRIVDQHTYSFGFVAGFQPVTLRDLMKDEGLGTIARFLFLSAVDPRMPDREPSWPRPLSHSLPEPASTPRDFGVAASIQAQIKKRKREVDQGKIVLDEPRAHEYLLRLKVSAHLAMLDGRLDVTVEDWDLAGLVVQASLRMLDAQRERIHEEDEKRERAVSTRQARRATEVDEAVRRRRLVERARDRMIALVGDSPGNLTTRDLESSLSAFQRVVSAEALREAVGLRAIHDNGGHWHPGAPTAVQEKRGTVTVPHRRARGRVDVDA